jgi:transcriptional regulator with XRE-family HTH domain
MKMAYSSQLKKLGKKTKKLRLSRKLTQQKLADLCDVDIRTIQRIEKGEHGIGLHIIFALADSLEIAIADLFKD